MPDNTPNALLTDAQREFLRGEKTLTQQQKAQYCRRIRERLEATLTDFSLLTQLPPELYESVFEQIQEDRDSNPELAAGIGHALGLLYLATSPEDGEERFPEYFVTGIVDVAEYYYLHHHDGLLVDIDIDISRREQPLDELQALFEGGELVDTLDEFQAARAVVALYETERITKTDRDRWVDEHQPRE